MLRYKEAISDIELYQILELQQVNLPKNLSKKEKAEQDSLTVKHSFAFIKSNECNL